jgi:hypothetical protein
VATVTGSAAAGASHAPAVPEASGCTAAGVGRPISARGDHDRRDAGDEHQRRDAGRDQPALARRVAGHLDQPEDLGAGLPRARSAPRPVTARAGRSPAAADQRVARASTGLLRRVAASAKDRSAPRADDVTSLARRTNARGSGRAGAIGSRSSNRIGSGAGSATSGGARREEPLFELIKRFHFERQSLLAARFVSRPAEK